MPSIYPQLKSSDRKFIRREKARIRRQFLDVKKQEELISELYKRLLGKSGVKVETEKVKEVKTEKPVEKAKIKNKSETKSQKSKPNIKKPKKSS